MNRPNVPSGVNAALIALSHGRCYFPDCPQPVIVIVEGRPVMNLHRSHIVAAKPGGPRDDPSYSREQRNRFENYILLCYPHHQLVDVLEPDNYEVHTLMEWKQTREAPGLGVLNKIPGQLDEAQLQELIAGAMDERVNTVKTALERFANYDLETAQVLRRLLDSLDEYQLAGNYLDIDAIATLDNAATNLRRYLDPDIVDQLDSAASKLSSVSELSDVVDYLDAVIRRMPPPDDYPQR